MKIDRRLFLGGAAAAGALTALAARSAPVSTASTVRPEDFGAKGDGIANDTDAFAAMSAHINRLGGGTVVLRKTTYRVGRQVAAARGQAGWAYSPATIMDFKNLRRPLVIQGNGARIKCAPGLRYGTFDRASGQVVRRTLPNYRQDEIALPYRAMIVIAECQAQIEISDLELDGSLPQLRIGGPYGDNGYQIPTIGLFLQNNRAAEIVRNLHVHHHAQDGIEIDGDDKRRARSRFENVVCEYNGRQGVSVIGGRGYDFVNCKFNHTGRSTIGSSPGAGVDLEAEGGKINRDFTFTGCEFSNNLGCGMVADSGDTEGATFTGCTFVGTSSWSAWPFKPRFRFKSCTFVGSVVRVHTDPDPSRAAMFEDCRFLDDPRLAPGGKVYLGGKKNYPIVDMADSWNIRFTRCQFLLTRDGLLPWSWRALYTDCTMQQAAPDAAYPKGKYFGRNTIRGNVDLYGTVVVGSLVVNGRAIPRGQFGGEPW